MLRFVRLLENGSLFLDTVRKDQWHGMLLLLLLLLFSPNTRISDDTNQEKAECMVTEWIIGEKSVCECDGTDQTVQMHANRLADGSCFMLTVLFSLVTGQLPIGTQMQLQHYSVELKKKNKIRTPFSSDTNTVERHCAAFRFAAALSVWVGGGDSRRPSVQKPSGPSVDGLEVK